ncbi:hypothetical protein [Streptomyces sp. NPDC006552]|uniref:hypothetical protein n=1 Tax=Streptomyces sp. NPDC006552 TaxID=3157179 RepID=UPI0033A70F8C
MHAIRATSAAVLSVAALALAASPASAGDADDYTFEVNASPTTVAPGGQVMLSQTGCKGTTEVSSGIFDTITLTGRHSSRSVTVDWDAKRGAMYSVKFSCEGHRSRSLDLTIEGDRPDDPTPTPVPIDHGVNAGAGGSIGGFDLREMGLGAALIAGALGTAYSLVRRRTGDGGS